MVSSNYHYRSAYDFLFPIGANFDLDTPQIPKAYQDFLGFYSCRLCLFNAYWLQSGIGKHSHSLNNRSYYYSYYRNDHYDNHHINYGNHYQHNNNYYNSHNYGNNNDNC